MNADIIVGIFSTALSAAYLIASWLLPDATIGNPLAPKFFPLGIGALALICSLLLLSRGVKRGYVAKKGKQPDAGYWVLIAGLVVCCLVYAAVLEKIGFLISTPLFLGAMLFLINGVKGWLANVIVALAFSFSLWYIFSKVFLLTLP